MTTTSCGPAEGVVAVVGEREVRLEVFQAHLEDVTGLTWESVDTRACSGLLDRYLEQEGVVAAAAAAGAGGGGIAPMDSRDATVRHHLLDLCGPVPAVSPGAVDHEAATTMENGRPEEIHLRQLFVATLEMAAEVRRRLAEGESYDELSNEVSRAPNADRGGELGWFARGVLPEDVEKAVFGLEPGAVSEPVGGPGGYHVFQVVEVKAAGSPNPEKVRRDIRQDLEAQVAREHLRACLEKAVETVGITVTPANLWFEYSGKYSEDTDEK